jgi:hypothetical protein
MTPAEKKRIIRQCRQIAEMIWDCEDYMRDLVVYHLAEAALALRDYPLMRRAIEYWEAIPAAKRAHIEEQAAYYRGVAEERARRLHAEKPPSLEEPIGPHPRPGFLRLLRRFRALHIAASYGTYAADPLRTRVREALMVPAAAGYAPALIAWDTRPAEERAEVITRAAMYLAAHGFRDDWWIAALNLAPLPPDEEGAETLSAAERARLSKRFATMNREEHAAD